MNVRVVLVLASYVVAFACMVALKPSRDALEHLCRMFACIGMVAMADKFGELSEILREGRRPHHHREDRP